MRAMTLKRARRPAPEAKLALDTDLETGDEPPFSPATTEEAFPYPEGHPAADGASGFWGSLTPEQEELLRQFMEIVEGKDLGRDLVDLGELDPLPEYAALRFLRACKWDVEVAVDRMESHVAWRRSFGFDELLRREPAAILGCDPAEVNRYYPHWQLGFDRQHRPILLKQYGDFEIWNLLELTTMDRLLQYHVWFQQKGVEIMKYKALREQASIETYTIVLDVGGMGPSQVTRDFLRLVQAIAGVDQNEFPERLGAMFIINVPRIFPLIFRGVKPFLDPDTCKKFQIFGPPQEWMPVLQELVDPAGLPPKYGGTGPPLPPFTDVDDIIHDLRHGGDGVAPLPRVATQTSPVPVPSDLPSPQEKDDDLVSTASTGPGSEQDFFDSKSHSNGTSLGRWNLPLGSSRPSPLDVQAATSPRSAWRQRSKAMVSFESHGSAKSSGFHVDGFVAGRIRSYPLMTLGQKITKLAIFHLVITAAMIGTVGGMLRWAGWTAELVQSVMWLFVVLMLHGVLTTLVCVTTMYAVRHALSLSGRILSGIYLAGGFLDLAVALACFVLGPGGLDDHINWSSVLENAGDGSTKAGIRSLFRRYYLAMGVGLLILAAAGFAQFLFLTAFVRKRKRAIVRAAAHKPDPKLHRITVALREVKVVLRLISSLGLLFSAVFVGYGGYAVHYAASANFLDPLFTLYMVLVLGVGVMLLGFLGLQASAEPQRPLLAVLLAASTVFGVLLISWASVCFSKMSQTGQQVNSAWASLTLSSGITADDVSSHTKLALLVTGTLLLFAGLFMVVNVFAYSTGLRILSLVNLKRLLAVESTLATEPAGRLRPPEAALLCWAAVTGFCSIFLDGTFAIFSSVLKTNSSWFLMLWVWLGKSDLRYVASDSFLVAMNGTLALVGGPLCFLLAVAIIRRHSSQSGLAITAALLQIYSLVLYWSTEVHVNFRDMDTDRPGFWIVIFTGDLFRLVVAFWVVVYSFNTLQAKAKHTERLKEHVEEMRALLPDEAAHSRRLATMQKKLEDYGIIVEQPGPSASPTMREPTPPKAGFLDEFRSPDLDDSRSVRLDHARSFSQSSLDTARFGNEADPEDPPDFDLVGMQDRARQHRFKEEEAETDYHWWG